MTELVKLTAKDFATDQEVRWCPGCGDYAVLKAVQRTMPDLGADPSRTVFVSGIGCSSRVPYYMETYGFHTIHGRAPAIATGVKLANPDLDVWIITGDGDALSIGGNHTMHILRRNLDCQILLFNNEIYGLTKGQYSPTSRVGTRSPSTPFGSVDRPVSPCAFALGSGARFVARGIDVHKNLPDVLKAAHAHKGASFVEIFQNCIVYNDDVFAPFTAKDNAGKQLWLKAGEPMLFDGGTKGLILDREALNRSIFSSGSSARSSSCRSAPSRWRSESFSRIRDRRSRAPSATRMWPPPRARWRIFRPSSRRARAGRSRRSRGRSSFAGTSGGLLHPPFALSGRGGTRAGIIARSP